MHDLLLEGQILRMVGQSIRHAEKPTKLEGVLPLNLSLLLLSVIKGGIDGLEELAREALEEGRARRARCHRRRCEAVVDGRAEDLEVGEADRAWGRGRTGRGAGLGAIIGDVRGREELGDDAVTIRLVIKSSPGDQWGLARALRLRIKKALDERGMEIPFPQRTIWLRTEPESMEAAIPLSMGADGRDS